MGLMACKGLYFYFTFLLLLRDCGWLYAEMVRKSTMPRLSPPTKPQVVYKLKLNGDDDDGA